MADLGSFDLSYDVVICMKCGFVFADNIIDEQSLHEYYRTYSKYDIVSSIEAVPLHTRQSAANCAAIVSSHLPPETRVIDIGSSIGVFLNELKQTGFSNLYGIDPAPACSKIARTLFDIEVDCGFLTSKVDLHDYDLIVLSNILEHITDLGSFLAIISSTLKKGAHLFIEVPAGDMFFKETTEYMGEFSIEHINYFGVKSLERLLGQHGFHMTNSSYATYGKGIITIDFLCVFDGISRDDGQRDSNLKESMVRYVETNRSIIRRIDQVLGCLSDKIAIYGAGSHTARLLKQSDLQSKTIVAVVDNNPNLIGKTIDAAIIEDAREFGCLPDVPVLISSYNYQEEIRKILIDKGFEETIVTVY